jgi:hypothetical protein
MTPHFKVPGVTRPTGRLIRSRDRWGELQPAHSMTKSLRYASTHSMIADAIHRLSWPTRFTVPTIVPRHSGT